MFEVDEETYLTAAGAARFLRISRFQFYYGVKGRIRAYKFEWSPRNFYRQSELEMFLKAKQVA